MKLELIGLKLAIHINSFIQMTIIKAGFNQLATWAQFKQWWRDEFLNNYISHINEIWNQQTEFSRMEIEKISCCLQSLASVTVVIDNLLIFECRSVENVVLGNTKNGNHIVWEKNSKWGISISFFKLLISIN